MASFRQIPRIASCQPLLRPSHKIRTYAATRRPATDSKSPQQAEQASEDVFNEDGDPNMNGNYPDPSLTSALPIKRQHRDPYGEWWDPIERRNYGETVHEDNDILGAFSTEDYTWTTPGRGAIMMGAFLASLGALMLGVRRYYPDKPSAPRTFPGGLEAELGGPKAVRARAETEEESVL